MAVAAAGESRSRLRRFPGSETWPEPGHGFEMSVRLSATAFISGLEIAANVTVKLAMIAPKESETGQRPTDIAEIFQARRDRGSKPPARNRTTEERGEGRVALTPRPTYRPLCSILYISVGCVIVRHSRSVECPDFELVKAAQRRSLMNENWKHGCAVLLPVVPTKSSIDF